MCDPVPQLIAIFVSQIRWLFQQPLAMKHRAEPAWCVHVCGCSRIRIYVCMSEAYLKRRTWTFWDERERKGEEGNGLCVLYVSIFLALFVKNVIIPGIHQQVRCA